MRFFFTISLINLFVIASVNAQITQVIKGSVIDKESKSPLIGSNVIVLNSNPVSGAITDINGNFKLTVPVGRISLKVTYVGYEEAIISQIEVIAGKELFLTIELRESVSSLQEVIVKAHQDKNLPLNTMASVSARMISTEDATRYAAGYFDPARMVSSFAGVSGLEGDGKNDIIVRGNSPRGLLWKLEGVEIPSPNHFSDGQGDSGGAFCIISSDVLANSDFYTGAFPSEYGNALSGILDLNLRKGNPDRREYGITAGIVGSSISMEGPIPLAKGSSYLLNYRYANFQPLNKMGLVDLGANSKAPIFQDIAFNINLPSLKAGTFLIFGVGGMSQSGRFGIKDTTQWLYNENLANDEVEDHKMGIIGIKNNLTFPDKKTYLKSNISMTYLYDRWDMGYLLYQNYNRFQYRYSKYVYPTLKTAVMINHKFNAAHTIRAGIEYSELYYNMFEQRNNYQYDTSLILVNQKGETGLAEAYFQWKYRLTERLELNTGLHSLYFLFNKHNSVEPRAGLKWQITDKSSVSYGFGIHSRIEPISAYSAFVPSGDTVAELNKNANFTRAIHNVLGYDLSFSQNLRLKLEIYYQYLFDVPILDNSSGTWSALNAQFGIPEWSLSNKGKGYNKGIECTLEKFYSNDYYYLVTLSLFDSKFRAGNNQLYNTYYNGNYVTNWLFGKDLKIGKNKQNIFGINLKTLIRGGFRYPDQLMNIGNITIQPYSKQMPYYLRFDLGLKYRKNNNRYSWIVSIDVQNVTNRKNVLAIEYNNNVKRFSPSQMALGIVPILNFKVVF